MKRRKIRTALPAVILVLALSAPGLGLKAASPAGIGWVSGHAEAVYLLRAGNAAAPPSYSANGFEQRVKSSNGGWLITVKVSASPLRVRQPFHPGKLPASLPLPPGRAEKLRSMLADCRRSDEAVNKVMLFLKSTLAYSATPDFKEATPSVLAQDRVSCVGAAKSALLILRALGIPCRPVVGIRVPIDNTGPLAMSGGILHAWIEIDFPGVGKVFCDPFCSTNWVSQRYIVLRVGDGLSVGNLSRLKGGRLEVLAQKDRLFFEPPPRTSCLLWSRPPFATVPSGGALVTGKCLKKDDVPAKGEVILRGGSGSVKMKLWNGNFFFTGLSAGVYSLVFKDRNGEEQEKRLSLCTVDKMFVIFYSQIGRQLGGGTKK